MFDSEDTFVSHVGKVCHACYYHVRDLQRICKFLTVDTAVLTANVANVSSQLDYFNSLLYGANKGSVAKLQKVPNVLCCVVFKLSSLIKSSSLTGGNRVSVSSVCPRKAIARHGFATAALLQWNSFAFSVRSKQSISNFRSQLKFYMFRLA